MYKHGDLMITKPRGPDCDDDDFCEDFEGHTHVVRDSRDARDSWEKGPGAAYLPHSCDYWVVGGADQIRAMIADLQAALVEIESMKGDYHAG